MKNKLIGAGILTASLTLVSACGVSPNAPSDLPLADSQAVSSMSSDSVAHTSGKRQIQPPSTCGLSQELELHLATQGRGFVEVVSNVASTTNRACSLSWSLEPSQAAKEMATEPAATKSAGLRVYTATSTLSGFWIVANSPDGQQVRLYLPLSSDPAETAALTPNAAAQTSRRRSFAPPVACAFGQELTLWVATRGRGFVEVASNYLTTDRGCPALAWEFDPSDAAKELAPESFAAAKGEGLRLNTASTTLRGLWLIATTPDGQVAKLHVDFASLSPRD